MKCHLVTGISEDRNIRVSGDQEVDIRLSDNQVDHGRLLCSLGTLLS
jgi:hypothetical protein